MPLYEITRFKNRKGSGELAGNPSTWQAENFALNLREALGIGVTDRLDVNAAFSLLPNVDVVALGDIPMCARYIEVLRRQHGSWSGAAIPMGGSTLVVYNDSHTLARTRVTLMEEFFHLALGHAPSTIRVSTGETTRRLTNEKVEDEAYFAAASALVPHKGLRLLIDAGFDEAAIAENFGSSIPLVRFRAKVTRTFKKLRSKAKPQRFS